MGSRINILHRAPSELSATRNRGCTVFGVEGVDILLEYEKTRGCFAQAYHAATVAAASYRGR